MMGYVPSNYKCDKNVTNKQPKYLRKSRLRYTTDQSETHFTEKKDIMLIYVSNTIPWPITRIT